MLRRQLPVHSPFTWRAIAAGAAAVARGDARGALRQRVLAALGSRYGARDALLTDSGTTALRLAIAGATAGREGTVALPGYTCYDMASAAEGAGARVLLYDLDPRTLGPDPESLAAVGAVGPDAVVLGHLFGLMVDVPTAAASAGDAVVIEDAAQGAGGRLHGRPLGSFGSVSVLSFGRGKGITGGGGGALLAHDDRGVAIVEWARERSGIEAGGRGLVPVIALAAQMALGRPALYGMPAALPFLHLGETVYHSPRAPRQMAAACAAVLERVLGEADREAEIRAGHAGRLAAALARSPRLAPLDPVSGGSPGYLRLPAVVRGSDRGIVVDRSALRLGVAAGYPTTLAELPSLAPRLVGPKPRVAGCTVLAQRLVTLPTHRLLEERDLRALEDWLTRG